MLPSIKDKGESTVVNDYVRAIISTTQSVVGDILKMKGVDPYQTQEENLNSMSSKPFLVIPVIGIYVFRKILPGLANIYNPGNSASTKKNLLQSIEKVVKSLKVYTHRQVECQTSNGDNSDRSQQQRKKILQDQIQIQFRGGNSKPMEHEKERNLYNLTVNLVETCAILINSFSKCMVGNKTHRRNHLYFHPFDGDAFDRIQNCRNYHDSPLKLCLTTMSLFLRGRGCSITPRTFINGLLDILSINARPSYINQKLKEISNPQQTEKFPNDEDFMNHVKHTVIAGQDRYAFVDYGRALAEAQKEGESQRLWLFESQSVSILDQSSNESKQLNPTSNQENESTSPSSQTSTVSGPGADTGSCPLSDHPSSSDHPSRYGEEKTDEETAPADKDTLPKGGAGCDTQNNDKLELISKDHLAQLAYHLNEIQKLMQPILGYSRASV